MDERGLIALARTPIRKICSRAAQLIARSKNAAGQRDKLVNMVRRGCTTAVKVQVIYLKLSILAGVLIVSFKEGALAMRCPVCDEVVFDREQGNRYADWIAAFQRRVNVV